MKNILVAAVLVFSLVAPFSALDLVQYDDKSKNLVPLDGSYFNLAGGNFTQDWTNTGLITANDNWTGVPSVEGFLGQDITTATGTDPQTLLGTSAVANDLDVIANQAAATSATGGVGEFDGLPNPTVGFQGSGTADAPHLLIYLNSTGRQSLQISYNLRDIDGTADNAVQPVALQYRVGATGDFTNLPAGFVADATTGPSLATLVTPVNVTLPAAVNNQAQVQIRVITTNAVGSDEWVGVDDIVVSSSPVGGNAGTIQFTSPTLTVAESGAFATITASRTGGTDGSVGVSYATSNGTATAGPPCNAPGSDYNSATGSLVWGPGDAVDKFFTFPICDDADFEGDETVNVTMSSPTGGATIGTPSSVVVTITDNDPQAAVIQFSTHTYISNESQTAILTVTRSGDTSGTSTVDLASSAVTATPNPICGFGGDYIPPQTTLTFSPGITTREYEVPLCADSFTEMPESLNATLSNPSGTGAVLGATNVAEILINDTASRFRNDTNIAIEDGAQANPYPSNIVVEGEAGPVGSIRVTLYGMQHINASDVDVLLVGPGGQNLILMSDAGGAPGLATSKTLTFVDSAGGTLPQNAEFSPWGQYQPTSWTPGQPNFNSPAPVGPYNEPGGGGDGPNLTDVFGGTDPNGTWSLYIRDDNGAAVTAGGINGNVVGGWGLEIFTQPGAPTSISGQVRTLSGNPVRGALIQISGGNLAQPRFLTTNTFGYYNIAGLQAGQAYTIQVAHRKYTFLPDSVTFTSNSNLSGADFIATP